MLRGFAFHVNSYQYAIETWWIWYHWNGIPLISLVKQWHFTMNMHFSIPFKWTGKKKRTLCDLDNLIFVSGWFEINPRSPSGQYSFHWTLSPKVLQIDLFAGEFSTHFVLEILFRFWMTCGQHADDICHLPVKSHLKSRSPVVRTSSARGFNPKNISS